MITPAPADDFQEFDNWVKSLFDRDPLAYMLVYQIFEAMKDKRMTGLGVIVEKEERKQIENSEIADLALFLTEKGLLIKRKRDTI